IPLRVTVGPRTLQNGNVEVKWRVEKEAILIAVTEAVDKVKELVQIRK
ncbi:MAG: hypothetical protein H8D49_04500, partial [Dehalococcoidia bacterium]|nr:hypothetical protein [Dehalococcoidia bacterium]